MDTASTGFHFVATAEGPWGDKWGYEKPSGEADARRVSMVIVALEVFEWLPSGAHVFCEEPLALQNGKTTRLLGLAAGALFGAFVACGHDAFWHWVDPASWKKKVLGRGAPPVGYAGPDSHKRWIRDQVRARPEWRDEFKDAEPYFEEERDLYDAYCLREYGLAVLEEG